MVVSHIITLLKTHEALDDHCLAVAKAIRQDVDLPVFIPESPGAANARELAVTTICQRWHSDPGVFVPKTGILCVSPATLEAVNALNTVKQQFKAAVANVRRAMGKDKSRLDALIDRVLQQEGRREPELELALRRAGLGRLDLLRCYAQVRVLPKRLQSLSWTWATTHSSVVPVTHKQAMVLAQSLPEAQQAVALAKLFEASESTWFALKKNLPNQLRANLVWEGAGGLQRKSIPVSGVLCCQDVRLPRHVWRPDPDTQEVSAIGRLKRRDTSIESEPYIFALNLYRYRPGRGPKQTSELTS